MSTFDLVIIAGAGVLGWWLVSWLIDVSKQKGTPGPAEGTSSGSEPAVKDQLSVAELGQQWFLILNVPESAGLGEIERAYQAALSECDRIAVSGSGSHAEMLAAVTRRRNVEAAYAFIRSVR